MISLKKGVSINGMKPEILLAIFVAEQVYAHFGFLLTVTSVNDSKHGFNSLHYIGYAFDCRTRNIEKKEQFKIKEEIEKRLGSEFDVLVESDHIHIEFQPEKGINL